MLPTPTSTPKEFPDEIPAVATSISPRRHPRGGRGPTREDASCGHRRDGRHRRAARGVRPRTRPGAQRAPRAHRGGGRQPDRREDTRRRGRLRRHRRLPRDPRLRLQRHRRAITVRVPPAASRHARVRNAALPPLRRQLRRVRGRPVAVGRAQALVALARRGRRRASWLRSPPGGSSSRPPTRTKDSGC